MVPFRKQITLPNDCSCSIEQICEDMVKIIIGSGYEFDVEDAEYIVDWMFKLGGGKRFKTLVVVEEGVLPTPEAQIYSSSEEGSKYKSAEAFVVKTIAQRLIGNFIVRFHKPQLPTKVFNEAEPALVWLNNQP